MFLLGIFIAKHSLSDVELWNSFLRGDKEAISELFVRYHPDLYRYGLKINHNEEAVHDGIQELFLRLWNKREYLSHAKSVKKYLIVSLRRILLDQLKKYDAREKRENEFLSLSKSNYANAEEEIIEYETEDERKRILQEAVSSLTMRQKEILFLKYYEGFENKEISEIMGITYQRVRNLLHETIEKLKEYKQKVSC